MKIVAIMCVFNEERFIAASLDHWQSHGIHVHLIDNESTDRTVAIAKQYHGGCLLEIEHLPRNGVFNFEAILKRKEELAHSIDADWFLHVDADEFHQPWSSSLTLHDALVEVDATGFNAANFLELTFVPTKEYPDHNGPNFQETLRTYYPFLPAFPHRLNAWRKQAEPVNLHKTAGHKVRFPGLSMYPVSFLMRHYLALSRDHAISKYKNRRHPEAALKKGWHRWRNETPSDRIVLPSREELRQWNPGMPPDTSNPRKFHCFDPRASLSDEEASAGKPDDVAHDVSWRAKLFRYRGGRR